MLAHSHDLHGEGLKHTHDLHGEGLRHSDCHGVIACSVLILHDVNRERVLAPARDESLDPRDRAFRKLEIAIIRSLVDLLKPEPCPQW